MTLITLKEEWKDQNNRTRKAGEILSVDDDVADRLVADNIAVLHVRRDDPDKAEIK